MTQSSERELRIFFSVSYSSPRRMGFRRHPRRLIPTLRVSSSGTFDQCPVHPTQGLKQEGGPADRRGDGRRGVGEIEIRQRAESAKW